MNVKNIAKNFGHPRGKVGERVGLWLIENKPCYDQLFEFIEASPNSRILEIGYGPGYGINDLYKTTGCFIDGIDISKEMYIKARTLNSDGILSGKVRILYGDFGKYKLGNNKYDYVYLINVIYFWSKPKTYIDKIAGLLNTNGKIIIFMSNPNSLNKGKVSKFANFNKHSIDSIVQIYHSAGLTNIKIEEFREEDDCFYIIGAKT